MHKLYYSLIEKRLFFLNEKIDISDSKIENCIFINYVIDNNIFNCLPPILNFIKDFYDDVPDIRLKKGNDKIYLISINNSTYSIPFERIKVFGYFSIKSIGELYE